ncbi:uncharacterized protein DDB_G0284459-like [Eutrema salsugineum]|uniref:uncharacterized protein DDB_G0284459-like n=1 Tax=Eutrema salsugineum TaxID=72664 RepID=UPI000CED1658|nr:uncharacterized protein DDB_G0284459-like [Eutrema salsugineum]
MDTEENQEDSNEDVGEECDEDDEYTSDDEAASSDANEDIKDPADGEDAAYSDGEDYSVYSKVKDEDDDEDEVCIDNVRNGSGETGRTPMSWSDNIYVRESFPTKEKLLSHYKKTILVDSDGSTPSTSATGSAIPESSGTQRTVSQLVVVPQPAPPPPPPAEPAALAPADPEADPIPPVPYA